MAFFTRSKVFGDNDENEREIIRLRTEVETLRRDVRIAQQQMFEAHEKVERQRGELDEARAGAKKLRKVIKEMTAQHDHALMQQRHDFTLQVNELAVKVTGLTAQRDTAQANFEWARLMFNKGEAERAILTSRILERPVQPFTIEREAAPPPPTDGTAGAAGKPAEGVDRPKPTAAMDTAIGGLANRFGVIFEDVGDDEARAQGIDHEE